jgi:hypothetical protein
MNTKLINVHPELVAKVNRLLYALAELGFPMMVTDGARTDAEQILAYKKGRDASGRVVQPHAVVTNCDGIHTRSNHQVHEDGFAYAVDCCFLVDGRPSWDDKLPWDLYGLAAEKLGLRWGGRWSHPVDRPHIEMPVTAVKA